MRRNDQVCERERRVINSETGKVIDHAPDWALVPLFLWGMLGDYSFRAGVRLSDLSVALGVPGLYYDIDTDDFDPRVFRDPWHY